MIPMVEPDAGTLARIGELCDAALFMQAHALAQRGGAFETWESVPALCTASRLARHLGAPLIGRKCALKAYRREPQSAEARFWAGTEWFELRGPLATWEWLQKYEPPADTAAGALADLCWLKAMVFIAFRDFAVAQQWLTRADALEPNQPYTRALRVSWLSAQDRYDEALELAQAAVQSDPGHRPSVQALAALLQLHGRFDEAVDLLLQAAAKMECGALYLEAARLQLELGRYAAVDPTVDRAQALLPLADAELGQRFASLRSDAAYHLGDTRRAIAQARAADTPFFSKLADRIAARRSGARVLLEVGFVRQHHLTCVPATLTTLARYWNQSVDQLELADRICYDGTRAHAERQWAEQNGWVTREFTATWETARALLDRRVPFILDTVHVVSAHAQAVIGYDERRGTLYIRDPFLPATMEAEAEAFLDAFKAHGPRGFALVPKAHAALLEGIRFQDAELFDLADSVEAALEAHDRSRASTLLTRLEAEAPDHRLTLLVRRAIAAYDSNWLGLQAAIERGLERYPNEPTWLLSLIGVLRQTAPSRQVAERLAAICADPKAHPVFQELLAQEHIEDARCVEATSRRLRQVARQLRERAAPVGNLAHCEWSRLRFDRALDLYRLAACVEPTNEQWAQAYFRAALVRGQSEQALGFLTERAERFVRRAAAPAISLFHALEALDRAEHGFEALDRALSARPDDGDLLRFAAEALARYARFEPARARLEAARAHSPRAAWLRSAATIAVCAGEHQRALELTREILEAEPLAIDAHRSLAARLTAIHSPGRAIEHLTEVSARFPENAALLELRIEWLKDEEPREIERALRALLALQPENAWAQRELALTLARLGRFPEAQTACEAALALAPHEVQGALTQARVQELSGRFDLAKAAYQAALELTADSALAISSLVEMAADADESLSLLQNIERRVTEASTSGDGILAWYHAARRHLEPSALGARLTALRERRADCWTVWLCSAQHLRGLQAEAAVPIAEEAVERFPLLPALWLELSRCQGAAGNAAAELAAAERAVTIAPHYVAATLALAETLGRQHSQEQALATLTRGLHFEPASTELLLARADLLWRLAQRDEALDAVQRAIELEPSNAEAWRRIATWNHSDAFDAVEMVARLAARRPWDPQMLLRLAELQVTADPSAALGSIDKAIELDPSSIEAHDLRAEIAARLGHRAVALAACRPAHFGDTPPVPLRGREAWISAAFGDVASAMTQMKQILRERPDYAWGHRELAEWADDAGEQQTALEAAQALVRLDPTSAMAHGYLGQALAALDKPGEARQAFRRALEIAPTYRFAADRYLSLLAGAKEFERAERALRRIARHAEPYDAAYFECRLAGQQGQTRRAEAAARAAFTTPDVPAPIIEAITHELGAARAEAILRPLIFNSDAKHAELVQAGLAYAELAQGWARCTFALGERPSRTELQKLQRRSGAAAEAVMHRMLDDWGERGRVGRALWFLLRHWSFIRQSDLLWGGMSFVFANANWVLATVLWMRGHERRRAQPWMLLNLAVNLRALGRFQAAGAVSRTALSLPPDHASPCHLTYLALDAVRAGQIEQAEVLLFDAGRQKLNDFFGGLHDLATSIVALHRAPAEERSEASVWAFAALQKAQPPILRRLMSLEGAYWRQLARIVGRESDTPSALLRGHLDTAVGLLIVLVVVLVVAAGRPTVLIACVLWGLVIRALSSRVRA